MRVIPVNNHNHLSLVKENIDFNSQGRQDKRPDRIIIPKLHGAKLRTNFSQQQNEYNKTKKFGEDFIFRVIKDNDKPVNYSKIGLILLAEPNKKEAIVQVENPIVFNSHLSDFIAEKLATKRVMNYSEFANLEEFVFKLQKKKQDHC